MPKQNGKNWHNWINTVLAVVAFGLSIITLWFNLLKPFCLKVFINPEMNIQYKTNFGLYLNAVLINDSPGKGLITDMGIVLYYKDDPENKFYFPLYYTMTFIPPGSTPVGVYTPSFEEGKSLPIFIKGHDKVTLNLNFVYDNVEQFPIVQGTYMGELLIFVDYNRDKPNVIHSFSFIISDELLRQYNENKNKGTSFLIPVTMARTKTFKSEKIQNETYLKYHSR